jgi:L-malate glycosyltransferase
MTKIKILHLTSEKNWRGGEQQLAYLIEEHLKKEVDTIVACRRGSRFETYCREKKIKCYALAFRNGFDLGTAYAIKEICKNEKVDLLHMHNAKSHGIGVLSAVLGNKTPSTLSRRVYFRPKDSLITKWKYNHSSIKKIIGVSDKVTSVMKDYVKDPSKCTTIHSGIDILKYRGAITRKSLHKEFNIPEDKILIGNSSALEPEKDYITFINTIANLLSQSEPVHGLIIGTGSRAGDLKEYCKQIDIEKHITFTGFRKDVVDILPQLSIFLMTSREEGLGTSILDAFASNVPVVATDAGGIPEMVVHSKTGMLGEIGNSKMLAGFVHQIIQDTVLRTTLIEGASEKVKDFSKEVMAEKTYSVYKELIGSTR